MKKLLLAISLLPLTALAQDVTSPDGALKVSVANNGGKASYTVSYNGTTVIADSPLGLKTTIGDLSTDLKLDKVSEVPCEGTDGALSDLFLVDYTLFAG